MFIFDLSFVSIFIIWSGIIVALNIFGFLKNKSALIAINLVISLILLVIHITLREGLLNWSYCVICDMVYLALSIGLFLYVNDIEARRRVISEVFENRYCKKK